MTKTFGLFLAGVAAAAFAVPAQAQTSSGGSAATSTDLPPAPTPAATDTSADIVVTAQRREQRLQDVPVAVTAITGDFARAAGLSSTDSIVAAVPGLSVQRTTGGASPFLRGVGSTNTGLGTSRAVALYVDDVYLNSAGSNVFTLNNIAQLEVSKGPQGTLFGRNATGGVIQIRTREPGSAPGLDAHIGYGNFDTISGDLYADARINDVLSVNFAASSKDQRHGYGINVPSGEPIYLGYSHSLRGRAKVDTGDTRLLLSADYFRSNEDYGLNSYPVPGSLTVSGGVYLGRYRTDQARADRSVNTQWGISGSFTHDFDRISLVSVSAIRHSFLNFSLDQDSGPAMVVNATLPARTDSVSQELRLQSRGRGPFTWIVGAYYYNEVASYDPITQSGTSQAANGGTTNVYARQELNSYSAFVDGTLAIGSRTNLTAGIRYTDDKYHEVTRTENVNNILVPGTAIDRSSSFDKFTYRAVLDHHITNNVMVYASYSRGFRSGGYVLTSPLFDALRPEVLDAYEVGIKNDLFDHRLRLNISGFHYDYSNLQVSVVQAGLVSSVNAAAARINGIDGDFNFRIANGINLSGGATYLDSRYTSFPNGQLFMQRPATCTPTPTRLPGAVQPGNLQCAVDLKGLRTPQAPVFTGNIGIVATQRTALGIFTFGANVYHKSDSFFASDEGGRLPAYTTINSSLTWSPTSERFSIRAWANNLTNEYYLNGYSHGGLRDAVSPAAPRTYGVTLGVHL